MNPSLLSPGREPKCSARYLELPSCGRVTLPRKPRDLAKFTIDAVASASAGVERRHLSARKPTRSLVMAVLATRALVVGPLAFYPFWSREFTRPAQAVPSAPASTRTLQAQTQDGIKYPVETLGTDGVHAPFPPPHLDDSDMVAEIAIATTADQTRPPDIGNGEHSQRDVDIDRQCSPPCCIRQDRGLSRPQTPAAIVQSPASLVAAGVY
jgi:hypothetical protein